MADDTAAVETSSRVKRAEKTKRLFANDSGDLSPRARLDSVAGQIVFVETGEKLDFHWNDLTEEVQRAAGLFGIMTAVTNTVGRKDMTTGEMISAAEDRLGTILDGEWTSATQSGPRTSDILEAAERAYRERGMDVSAEKRAEWQKKLADEESGGEFRATMLSKTAIKAHFEAIKAERAAARAAKARAAVGGDTAADELDL